VSVCSCLSPTELSFIFMLSATTANPRKQPLIPATYFCQEPRICNWVRRILVKYAVAAGRASGVDPAPTVITESIANVAVPYYLVLGSFEGKYVSLMADEGLRYIFEVPVIADRSFFRSGTVVSGDLIWEYPVVGGGSRGSNGNHPRVIPRQCFFVNRLFKVAGVEVDGVGSTTEYTLLRNLFDPLGADVLQRPRTWNEEARKLASTHRKIVCAGTCFGLIFKPRKWFPVTEKETMERLHIPNLRYEIDQPLRWVGMPGANAATDLVHLQLQVNLDTDLDLDWRIYYRSENWDKIDATLGGSTSSSSRYHIIFLPNELIMRWVASAGAGGTTTITKPFPLIIVLVRLSLGSGTNPIIEAETVAIRSEKALPDSEDCIRASCAAVVAKSHTNAA